MSQNLIDDINEILPQTQCTRCGYPSCRDYAEAIAKDHAEINQCPPGGNEGIIKLSHLLNKQIIPLNPKNGVITPRNVAVIDEDICIGCTLCIKACPVDAIIGSHKMMHTVIEDDCTGCDLCVPVCPVDCIIMVQDQNQDWSKTRQNLAKDHFERRNKRRRRDIEEREARLSQIKQTSSSINMDTLEKIMAKARGDKN